MRRVSVALLEISVIVVPVGSGPDQSNALLLGPLDELDVDDLPAVIEAPIWHRVGQGLNRGFDTLQHVTVCPVLHRGFARYPVDSSLTRG